MSVAGRKLRAEPVARGRLLERAAISLLRSALASLEHGALDVTLPDGSSARFGAGAPIELTIRDRAFLRRLATRGKLGIGESYTAGEWETNDLVGLFELLLRNAEAAAGRHRHVRRLLAARPRLNRRNGLLRARRNIAYHYDLGNELFALMLDETMTYSCAIFEQPDEALATAQRRKYRHICEKLQLTGDDRLLEIGCGWGGFAQFAATEYDCHVTGLTISSEQAGLARGRTDGLDVRILEQDYRQHEGRYTKLASIEMLEAIGDREFPTFFAAIDRLLDSDGLACVQTILIPDQRWDRYRRSPDWIERYVFPGCLIPSLTALTAAATHASSLTLLEVEEIGPHYAETLARWRQNFHDRLDEVRALGYDDRFIRTWDFYLAFSEAGFRTRALRDAQLTFTRPFNETIAP